MTPARVVVVDPDDDRPAGLGAAGEALATHEFALDRRPERLVHGVVLDDPTRPTDWVTLCFADSARKSRPRHWVPRSSWKSIPTTSPPGSPRPTPEGALDELGTHVFDHGVADDPTGALVQDVHQVEPALVGGDVGDVSAGPLLRVRRC